MRRIDATRILPRLYQGSIPPTGATLRRAGFGALVLAAEEHQPSARHFPGLYVLHAPLDDHEYPLTGQEWTQIATAAEFAAVGVRKGMRVLVTCQAGLNRSGIITAMAVMMLTGCSGDQAVRLVQSRREDALCNSSFAAQLSNLS